MMIVDNKQIGFIYKNNKSIDKIFKEGEVVFERGFLREKTSTTLPITFGGVGKNLKDYKIYGNTYQNSTTGKNLLNYVDNIISVNGLTSVINEDGSITTTGVPTVNYVGITTQYNVIDELEDGATYTISSETQNQYLYIQVNAEKIAGGTDYIYNKNSRTVQFTVDKSKYNKYNIKIQSGTSSAWGNQSKTITNKYQIEKGSATDFEPYTNGVSPNPDYPQEIISCGDKTTNLFDISTVTSVDNGSISDILITSSSFTSSNVQNVRPRFSTPFPYKTGTYYISADVRLKSGTGNLNKINDGFSDYTKVNFPNLTNEFQRYVVSHKYNSDTSYSDGRLLFQVASNSNELVLEIKNIMISTSNDYNYTPYGYKIPVNVNNVITNIYLDKPLRKIGDYSDYIDFKNGNVVRNIGSKLIDGSLNWVTSSFASIKRIYTLATTNISNKIKAPNENTEKATIISDKYKTESIEDILTATKKYAIGLSKTNYLSIQNQDYTYSTDLIQSLTDNPVELCYALSTPTEETITLPNIPTIDGNNTLNIETELTPSQVYIKYKSNE